MPIGKKKKKKNGENVSSLEVVEVVLVRCNLMTRDNKLASWNDELNDV